MVRDYLRYIGFRAVLLLCALFPQPFLYWIALRVADLNYYLLDPNGRRAVEENLRRVLPDASPERIAWEARWVFRNFGKYLSEFFRFRRFDDAFFRRHVAIHGQEHVEAALAKGRGVLVVSAHLSNWELGAAAIRRHFDRPVNVIAAMHRYGRVNRLFMREREWMGLSVIDMRKAPRRVLDALRRGEIVCTLGDRDPTDNGVMVDFFGSPCRFPQGPARFALATGAPVVTGYVLRRTNDSFSIVFQPPIEAPPGGSKLERVRAIMQVYARRIEEAIRWHPEEWGVFYPVWNGEWVP